MTNANLTAIAAAFGKATVDFRSAAVTADNKATPWARSALAALVSGNMTQETMVAGIIHAFGNPKAGAKNKPVDKLSGLQSLPGGDKLRKTATVVFSVFANIDADKESAGAIRKAVTAFILSEKDSAKSLAALNSAVKAALVAHAAMVMPDNADAVADNEADKADNAPAAPAAPASTLAELVNLAMVALQAAPDTELLEVYSAIDAFFNAAADRVEALTAPAAEMQQAA